MGTVAIGIGIRTCIGLGVGSVETVLHITIYSAIHKAAGRRSASSWNEFQLPAPFTAYGGFRNCTRQNHGTAGNREAGGFVNSAVKPFASESVSESESGSGNTPLRREVVATVERERLPVEM